MCDFILEDLKLHPTSKQVLLEAYKLESTDKLDLQKIIRDFAVEAEEIEKARKDPKWLESDDYGFALVTKARCEKELMTTLA